MDLADRVGRIILLAVFIAAYPTHLGAQISSWMPTQQQQSEGYGLMSSIPDSTEYRIMEVKWATFRQFGPGILVALEDSVLISADYTTQAAAARPIAEFVTRQISDLSDLKVVIIGWQRTYPTGQWRNTIPFPISELVTPEASR